MLSRFRTQGATVTLNWCPADDGALLELVLTGPGFLRSGFSLGSYNPQDLNAVVEAYSTQAAIQIPHTYPQKESYPCLYTHTQPVRYAKGQGPETRLAIHFEQAKKRPADFRLWSHGHVLFPPRTATIHEQGERSWWRWLGRYRAATLIAWITQALQVGTHESNWGKRRRGLQSIHTAEFLY